MIAHGLAAKAELRGDLLRRAASLEQSQDLSAWRGVSSSWGSGGASSSIRETCPKTPTTRSPLTNGTELQAGLSGDPA